MQIFCTSSERTTLHSLSVICNFYRRQIFQVIIRQTQNQKQKNTFLNEFFVIRHIWYAVCRVKCNW